MRAIRIRQPGGPEVLELVDLPAPEPGLGEVQIAVAATAVNRADLVQRLGFYPAPPDVRPELRDIPGLEIAGTVSALGPGVTELAVGDTVMGLLGGGGYAERAVAPARGLARVPAGLSLTDAAAVPEAFVTAYDAMVAQAGLQAGETVLVHACGSGVGTAALQIARAIGARALGTARSQDKLDKGATLGLQHGIRVERDGPPRFAEAVMAATGGRGVDVVLELVGGHYVREDLACVAERGRIVVVGLMAGMHTELDLGLLMRRRASVRGTMLRSRPLEEKILAGQLLARNLAPLLGQGALRPVIERVMPLEQASQAHIEMARDTGFGKIVLTTTSAAVAPPA
jgi:putative PIG3 family NAD(P)H quinone oxidoreductase